MSPRKLCSNIGIWWSRKTVLERILMVVLFVAFVIIAVLCGTKTKSTNSQVINEDICDTTVCLSAAEKILEFINPEIDPCDDFHKFVCGKFLENSQGDSNLALEKIVDANRQRSLLELYTEDVKTSDHKMVRFSKRIFEACMHTSFFVDDIDGLYSDLEKVGGWPAVQGDGWREDNFDWIQANYKLRDLGYTHSMFLDLNVKWDIHTEKLLLNIVVASPFNNKIPKAFYLPYTSQYIEIMTETAILFGAKDYNKVRQEMTDVYIFMKDLDNMITYYFDDSITLKNLQERVPNITWENFINRIIGPKATLSQDDTIMAPNHYSLKTWFNKISNTTKRIQANYMMWKVVVNALPYMGDQYEIIRGKVKPEERTKFCLEEIEQRFFPSPIDIMYDRKHLPMEKRKMMESILLNIKSEYIKYIRNNTWMDAVDKQRIINNTHHLNIAVGKEENYFDDQILDNLDVNMYDGKSSTFLPLISQANKNYYAHLYGTLNKKVSRHYLNYIQNVDRMTKYMEITDNVIFFPTSATIHSIELDKGKPNYLYYGAIGFALSASTYDDKYYNMGLFNKYETWSEFTMAEYNMKRNCIQQQAKSYNMYMPNYIVDLIFFKIISEQLAYSAYNNVLKTKNEESRLIGLNYTPKQLLWISGATHYCIPLNKYSDNPAYSKRQDKLYSNMITTSLRNIPEFAKDFNCPVGSKMNPINKCKV